VSLILLLVLTLIGVTAAQMQTVEESMALNDDNHQLALQSGEAVLRDSEAQFLNGDYAGYAFDGTSGAWTLALEASAGSSAADQTMNSSAFSTVGAVTYQGPTLGGVHVGSPYVAIENLPAVSVDGIPGNGYPVAMTTVRTTTLATGGDTTSNVVTQSIAYQAPQN